MKCKNCSHYDGKYCDEIGDEDETDKRYTHNNHPMIGLEINVSDDTGLDIRTRTNPEFGCILFEQSKKVI